MVTIDETNAEAAAKAVRRGELPGPAKSLAEAMARVYDRVAYVQKDKRMQGSGSYTYVSDVALIAALRPELVREGVTVAPVEMEVLVKEEYQTAKGGRMNRLVLACKFRFAHAASGESLVVQTLGEAADAGDKCANKAMTAAMKYALRQTFCVETGDDPDDTPSAALERAAPAKAAAPDNPTLRGKRACELKGCSDAAAFAAWRLRVVADRAAGQLSAADLAALNVEVAAWKAAHPEPAGVAGG